MDFRRLILKIIVASLAIYPLSLPVSAQAELADRNKPMTLDADKLTVNDIQKISTYEGHVVLNQGTMQIKADRLVITQNGKVRTAIAYGNPVTFHELLDNNQGMLKGQAQEARYNTESRVLELIGDARLTRNKDLIEGNTITYNIGSTIFKVNGGGSGGRVHAIFQPQAKSHAGQGGQ
ncbi:MAG: lipopolysaccharide transport periplasmic protein LptA [Pseudomonadota bacterium]|nr:lipopolysaccharide transport periplasmic protein LptA [Pseudomonadota bacterium]